MNGNYHAKIIPPRLHGVVPRERLFKLLDRFADHPITWISSPAGSGKTTLVASYLKTRGIPALWYRVDEADADIASFFYYMSEAAKNLKKSRKKPLPLFSSEFRFGIGAFTHHYFDSLFTKMSIPTALVFDNYQDVPEDSEFHNVIKDGLRLVPDGMRILIASRKESPAPFVTLKTDRLLAYMDWEDLRFRPDEVKKMVEQKQKTPVSKELIRRIHEETQGWAAAVVLMMDEEEMPAITAVGQSSVFNYFAMEVFPKFDPQVRDFLCITALLPEVSPEISAKLTGIEEGDAILTYLSRNQYFITRYGKEYRYHPLFREFLLNQAKKNYDTDKLVSVKTQAAHLLVESGKIEEAIRLLFDAKAYKEALPVILSHAQKLLSQGRRATLEEWAESLPEDIRETSAWLSYSLGMGQLLLDPRKSTALLTKAFHLFESEQDKTGCLLSASAIINSLMLKFNEYTSLDPWIDWLDSNAPANKPLPTPELEAQVASAMVLGITWRRPWHPYSKAWIDRAMSASRETDDISLRCTARGHVIENYGFIGHWKEMRLVAEELRQLTFSSHASTLVHIAYLFRVIETHDFLRDSWEDAYKRFQSAIKLAEEIGAHAFFGSVYMHGVWIAFELKNPQMVLDFLKKMEQTPLVGGWVGSAFYHDLSALYHLQMNDLTASHRDAMEAFKASIEASVPLVETWCRITLAYVLRRMGNKDEASAQIEEAEKIIAPCGLTHQLYLIYLVRASLALDRGDKPAAAQALRKAFSIGKEKGYEVTLFRYWQPDEMARLCAEALALGIEEEYVRELITRNQLVPTNGRTEDFSKWPWPCRIKTFGGFEMTIDGSPTSPEIHKRPLDLLRVLISLGGDEVRQETIEDELWPEAEGDMARIAFKTNLSRLRKIIGEKTIEVKDGKVSLNPQRVWLDLWALESLAENVSELYRKRNKSKSPDEVERLAHLAFDIYHGDFLMPDDDLWLNQTRQKLRIRFTKMLERLAQMLIESGEREKAALLYGRGMDMGIPPNNIIIKGLSPSQMPNYP